MICNNCRNQIPDDSNVCQYCGARIKEPEEIKENDIPAENPVKNTINEEPTPVNEPIIDTTEQSKEYYAPPVQNTNTSKNNTNKNFNEEEHVSTWHWLGLMAINLIPCVGPLVYIVMMFVFAFGDTPKYSLKTFARANLIMMLISFVLVILIAVICVLVLGATGTNFQQFINEYSY